MKQIINDYYLYPFPEAFKEYFGKNLKEDYLKIFNSITTYKGDSQFHYDNTMIPSERFEKLLRHMTRIHMEELNRLAIIGFQHDSNRIPPEQL